MGNLEQGIRNLKNPSLLVVHAAVKKGAVRFVQLFRPLCASFVWQVGSRWGDGGALGRGLGSVSWTQTRMAWSTEQIVDSIEDETVWARRPTLIEMVTSTPASASI